jgi:hypothetical protein
MDDSEDPKAQETVRIKMDIKTMVMPKSTGHKFLPFKGSTFGSFIVFRKLKRGPTSGSPLSKRKLDFSFFRNSKGRQKCHASPMSCPGGAPCPELQLGSKAISLSEFFLQVTHKCFGF